MTDLVSGSLWTSFCWICGKVTMPVSAYGAGQYEFYCRDCEVKWVTPDYWTESNVWKDHDGFTGYERYREKSARDEMKRYQVDELVDFGEPGAPGTPA